MLSVGQTNRAFGDPRRQDKISRTAPRARSVPPRSVNVHMIAYAPVERAGEDRDPAPPLNASLRRRPAIIVLARDRGQAQAGRLELTSSL
jgi:hypothetical protein